MSNPEKMFTLPLRRFIQYYVSTLDKRQIERDDAIVIAAIDSEETFCHVQFDDLDTGKKLDKPLVWNINDWRSNYQVHKHKKKQSAIDRIKWDIYKKNVELIAVRLVNLTFIDKEPALRTAELILKKNNPVALQNLGIKLATFDESMLPKDIYGV